MTFPEGSRIFRDQMSLPSPAGGPYGPREIRSLYPAITEKHLRYLEKWGLVGHGGPRGAGRLYTFTDLAVIRQAAAALEAGTPLRTILRTLLAERQGQLQLDFAEQPPAHAGPGRPAKVVALQSRRKVAGPPGDAAVARRTRQALPSTGPDPQAALAAKYFLEGSRLDDGTEDSMEQAVAAYRKALVLDPDLVPAIVNLANLHYASDQMIEAQALYERAINLDPDCFEAHFNLGNILHDLGRFEAALVCYRDAVALNPGYAEAHFYLAVTLEKTGHSAEAKPHWKAYQALAPNGEWAELAREFTD